MPKPKLSESNISSYQKFEIVTVNRRELKNAPYNPRKISDVAKKKLKAKIKKRGIVQPLTWNIQTRNLVAGHQRIAILDSLEGRDDYDLTVAQIDVDLKTEKELNVFLNNASAQGEWNVDLLKDLKVEGFDFGDLGFDKLDTEFIFEGTEYAELFKEPAPELVDQVKEYKKDKDGKDALDKIKEQRKKYREQIGEQDSAEFILIVVFPGQKEKGLFLEKHGIPPREMYISSDQLDEITGNGK